MWPLLLLFSALTGLGGLARQQQSSDRTARATSAGGAPGTYGRDEQTPTYLGDTFAPGDAGVQRSMEQFYQHVPYADMYTRQQQANQDALNAQKPYADANIANITGDNSEWSKTIKALGGVRDAGEQTTQGQQWFHNQLSRAGGPQAISTQTIDQMAARLMDQYNAQAGTASKIADETAARTGQSVGPYQQEIAARNSQANAQAMRDTQIQASLANSDYARQIAAGSSDIDQSLRRDFINSLLGINQADAGYATAANQANIDRASLEQPVNWEHLGDIGAGTFWNGLGMRNANDQAAANALLGLSMNTLGLGEASRQNKLARDAASGGLLGGLLGTLGGAGVGAAGFLTGNPLLGLMGMGVGSGIGGSVGGALGGGGGGFSPSTISNPLMGLASMYGAANPGAWNALGGSGAAAAPLTTPPLSTQYDPNTLGYMMALAGQQAPVSGFGLNPAMFNVGGFNPYMQPPLGWGG